MLHDLQHPLHLHYDDPMESKWLAFSYTLSAKKKSSARVALWRRLQRLGTISPVNGLYVLPARAECLEAFQWLAQEVHQAEGQAVVLQVATFDGLPDPTLIEHFQTARRADYATIDQQLQALVAQLPAAPTAEAIAQGSDELAKLRRRYAELVQIDYFACAERASTAAKLAQVTERLTQDEALPTIVPHVQQADYQGRIWVTRPQPYVDRLACSWLIRRFIDKTATIRYGTTAADHEITFDMHNATFGHVGNLCTFETMIAAFQLEGRGLQTLAEIVHELDLGDDRFVHPEAMGIAAILRGWLLAELDDQELEQRGLDLFDGIYRSLAARTVA